MASATNIHADDLDWLAFQYAAGELDGDELSAFELRLATDLDACEALAKAVTLGEVVAAQFGANQFAANQFGAANDLQRVEERSIVMSSIAGRSRAPESTQSTRAFAIQRVLALLSSAVCLAWMVSWVSPTGPAPMKPEAAEPTVGLATLWIQGADQTASHNGESGLESTSTFPRADEFASDRWRSGNLAEASQRTGSEFEEDSDEIPGWMLAAVAEQQREMGGDPEDDILHD